MRRTRVRMQRRFVLVNFGDINPFSSLMAFGNAAVAQTFVWDAENRLIEVRPTSPGDGDRKVVFGYDYLGRRVEKRVYDWEGPGPDDWAATPSLHRKFVWSGWLMLQGLDEVFGQDAVLRKYTWGLDLAGLNGGGGSPNGGGPASSWSLESAGGISGLLAVQDVDDPNDPADPFGDFVFCYDANGNVGQLVAWTTGFGGAQGDEWHLDRLVAHYEYDPYGNVIGPDGDADGDWTDDAGPYAVENPIRFSTKYWDDETGLGYWGYRYYSPALGRWLSYDPLNEQGAILLRTPIPGWNQWLVGHANLYAYVSNGPLNHIDATGLVDCWQKCGDPLRPLRSLLRDPVPLPLQLQGGELRPAIHELHGGGQYVVGICCNSPVWVLPEAARWVVGQGRVLSELLSGTYVRRRNAEGMS